MWANWQLSRQFRGWRMAKRMLSVPEAAEILDLTPKGLWGMVARRDIESVKVGRLRKIPVAAIEEYIAARTTPARQQANR